mmetsp:Transcript_2015/g.3152  ORF Transcript_2015/g.3152 Transcript_2015/m.3152 type:complete len:736 (-) Transcript_2015:1126-3333(-)
MQEPFVNSSNAAPPSSAAAAPPRLTRKRVVRGGWSTSIHALFDNPSRRSNFCAVTCCGVLLSDRNAYLMDGTTRPNWRLRRRLNVLLPLVLFVLITVLSTNSDASSDSSAIPYVITDDDAPSSYTPKTNSNNNNGGYGPLVGLLRLTFYLTILLLLVRGTMQRAKLRTVVVERMKQQQQGGAAGDTTTAATMTPVPPLPVLPNEGSFCCCICDDVRRGSGVCCCYANDFTYILAPVTVSDHNGGMMISDECLEGQRILAVEAPTPDLCTCMWKVFSNICCGSLCGCWLQLCGMCAIGQEDRELERLLLQSESAEGGDNKKLLQIDYITFQSWSEYYPLILNLRQGNETGFLSHFKALSQLSKQIVCYFAVYLAIVGIVSGLTGKLVNFAVLLATHAEALFVLYLVHWKWHKLTVSVDAVIKYFASGFVLSIFMAMVIESVMMIIFYPIGIIIFVMDTEEESGSVPLDQWMSNPSNIHDLTKHHLGQFAVIAFAFSFLVAALVEEICKYFGFWTAETPDLTKPADVILTTTTGQEEQQQHYDPGLIRCASRITVAMVAVATGFACAENLEYVMGQASVLDEVVLLIVRSLFPVHQLCAAIQSIGVVRRDLEGDKKFQLGRIILPAILLHGFYDFVAIFWGIFEYAETDLDPDASSSYQPPEDGASPPLEVGELLKTLALCCPVVGAGVLYYYLASEKQRRRLAALDHVQGNGSMALRLVEEDDQESAKIVLNHESY